MDMKTHYFETFRNNFPKSYSHLESNMISSHKSPYKWSRVIFVMAFQTHITFIKPILFWQCLVDVVITCITTFLMVQILLDLNMFWYFKTQFKNKNVVT